MDPTMRSPVRLPLPAPLDLEVPSGPHFYPFKTWVGSLSRGNTPQQAFEALLRHATPFQREPSINGKEVDIPGFGTVRQLVDPDRLTVVNSTLAGHRLHPGNVHRRIIQEGDDLYVVTHGYGTGILPSANEIGAKLMWPLPDYSVREELHPQPIGYPMDEMNVVSRPRAELRGPVSNEPMDFSINRPPIFFR